MLFSKYQEPGCRNSPACVPRLERSRLPHPAPPGTREVSQQCEAFYFRRSRAVFVAEPTREPSGRASAESGISALKVGCEPVPSQLEIDRIPVVRTCCGSKRIGCGGH